MTSVASTPILTPPKTYPACTDPGYIMTLKLGTSDYQVFAYIEGENGTKNYLPSTCDPQTLEKIRSLTWGLLNAHDSRRTSLNEAPYEMKIVNAKGLIKADNTTVSHDFLIQPVSTLVADQMASAISLAGHPMHAAAVKAQDVWTTMEEMIRKEIGRPPTPPVQSGSSTSANSSSNATPPFSSSPASPTLSPPSVTTQPAPQTSDQNPGPKPSNTPAPNDSSSIQPPSYRAPISATDFNLRREAGQIIEAFHQNLEEEALQEKIFSLMEKEFERKEQLFDCIRQQAEAEEIVIEDWDRKWAQHHYLENVRRFVQALARWLDIH